MKPPATENVQLGLSIVYLLHGRESSTMYRNHSVQCGNEFLARFDRYPWDRSSISVSSSNLTAFAHDSEVVFAKSADLLRFVFGSPHSANSQYLTNIHMSGPVKQRPVAMARST